MIILGDNFFIERTTYTKNKVFFPSYIEHIIQGNDLSWVVSKNNDYPSYMYPIVDNCGRILKMVIPSGKNVKRQYRDAGIWYITKNYLEESFSNRAKEQQDYIYPDFLFKNKGKTGIIPFDIRLPGAPNTSDEFELELRKEKAFL